jgi:hypothetical protein
MTHSLWAEVKMPRAMQHRHFRGLTSCDKALEF